MELVIKIALTGITVAVLGQILSRSGRDEYALLTVLAGIVAVVLMILPQLEGLTSSLSGIFSF